MCSSRVFDGMDRKSEFHINTKRSSEHIHQLKMGVRINMLRIQLALSIKLLISKCLFITVNTSRFVPSV